MSDSESRFFDAMDEREPVVLFDPEVAWRLQQEQERGRAEERAVGLAFGMVGLAVAGGEVLRFAERRRDGGHSERFLRVRGGSCEACTEAGIIASFAQRALLGAP